MRAAVVALVGNPNTGKTTLFNALTGFHRHVANYPGVTVELADGPLRGCGQPIKLLDLPGTYSLAAVSPDEMVVSNVLAGRAPRCPRPDVIVAIVDASNLQRNLYLVSQLLEFGLPLVVALNMSDVAEARGFKIDVNKLSIALGIPVVPVVAIRDATTRPLIAAIERVLADGDSSGRFRARSASEGPSTEVHGGVAASGDVRTRYAWIQRVLDGVVTRPTARIATWSDRLDRLLTHKLAGPFVLLTVLTLLFQSIFQWAKPLMKFINEGLFGRLAEAVGAVMPDGVLKSLVVDGVIAGVGGVLTFLPQIMILFALIAILEDCGYMARAAYMMDRVMRAAGLSGRSFIPLLSSFACAVPAIMGTRVISDRRERFVTILIAPFMSCAARLPVYVLMIGAFVPDTRYLGGWIGLPGLVMLAMYLVGITVALPIAWLLKKTAFAGPQPTFVLELPSYKRPRLRTIWQRVYFASKGFVIRAGTVILAVNLVVWALAYFPRNPAAVAGIEQQALAESWPSKRLEHEVDGAYLRDSFLGRVGRAIEPAIRPLGWDWRIGMAALASFPAREVVVATLGTIFNLGRESNEESRDLQAAMRAARWPDTGQPVFTLSVALSIMVFFALCAQCASTLVVIGRETGTWGWPLASFVGMTGIAYVAALVVSWAGRALGW